MGRALFYHLTAAPLEDTLLILLGKSLEAGLQVDVRGTDQDALARLDERLWLGPEESFLPHGLAGGPHDARQPILLTTAAEARVDTACVMAIHGAPVTAAEAGSLSRLCVLFDGHDPAALNVARDQWRALTGAGAVAEYWSQDSGRWQRKMVSGEG